MSGRLLFLLLGTHLITGLPSLILAAEKPHIILIMADDIGIEGLGCYGGTSYETPHLDEMARDGMRFTHAYSQPLCTPTRIQIMTGKYNHRNWKYFGILPPEERTFGHLMQEEGYRTCIAGKWQLQSYDPPDYPGSEERRGTGMKVMDAGFHEYSLFHAWETEDKGSRFANPTIYQNGAYLEDTEGRYGPDIWVDFIHDFMERNHEEPMFIYYPMALPHWPVVPTPKSEVWSEDPSRRLEEDIRYFPDMVEYMDYAMGEILRSVDELGLREDTIVMFYSDNGTDKKVTSWMGDQRVDGGKGMTTDAGVHVPFIVRWPGQIQPHSICTDLVDSTDFLPTLAALAGSEVPSDWATDGRSFLPQLQGEPGNPRDWVFYWYDPRPGWDKDQFTRHIFAQDKRYKYYSDGRFYDLKTDLLEESPLEELSQTEQAAQDKLAGAIREMMGE